MNNPGRNSELRFMKPFVPQPVEIFPYLEKISKSRWITNGGTIQDKLEEALCEYLGVKHICLFSSGTTALMMALRVLNIRGEVITTPFTSIATVQAILWNNLKPVFVDINETGFNIDPVKVETAITPETKVVLPVHVFGNPCDVNSIDILAKKHNLKIVYDAAHCFGVEFENTPVYSFGDLSVLSFHATKVFNTIEGGAIICNDPEMKKLIEMYKNPGLIKNGNTLGYGFNAKMNEVQAAFGLVNLSHIDSVIGMRKNAVKKYKELLADVEGLILPYENDFVKYNYSYFPVIIVPDIFNLSRDEVLSHLKRKNITAKKYFHPLATGYFASDDFRVEDIAVAKKVSENIICLPLFHDISDDEIFRVVNEIVCLNRD